jgi:DeoR family transcriptional regulator, aga operon transcriptional repressor
MSAVDSNRLLAEERRREILGVLAKNGRVTVGEISKRFGVSAVTARGDLNALSESGSLIRSRGGGIRPLAAVPEHPLKTRENIQRDEKMRIAAHAASMIRPGQTIILCTGSTSALLATALASDCPERLTVITHALNVATILGEVPGLSLVMLGGVLRHPSTAFVGPHAEQMMGTLHADHCFLSAVGLDPSIGITTLDIMEAHLNSRMIHASAQVTVLADSSKFGHRSLSVVTDFRSVHRVITDANAPSDLVEKLRERGIEVCLA